MKFIQALTATILFIIGTELVSLIDLGVLSIVDTGWIPFSYAQLPALILELVIVVFVVGKFMGWQALRPNEAGLKWVLAGFGLGAVYVYLQLIISYLTSIGAGEWNAALPDISFELKRCFKYFSIGMVLITPIAEELFFRRFLQSKLQEEYDGLKPVFMVTALFTLVHFPFFCLFSDLCVFSFEPLFTVTLGGFIASWLYYKSESILPSIIFHVIWNFTAVGYVLNY